MNPILTPTLSSTAQKAIAAYGGSEAWKNYKYIEAEVSASGLAFKLKRRPYFKHAKLRMEIARPYSELSPIGNNPGIAGVLDGDTVRLMRSTGEIIEERKNARSFFPGGKRLFKWDDLDMAYFANYALWNYFALPKLLMDSSITWTEKSNGVLVARFPETIPTHCKQQEFIFDPGSGLLLQHNYIVDIFGQWAKAANVIKDHRTEGGMTYASSRLVTPRKRNGLPRKRPALIKIEVHSFKIST